MQAKRNVRQQPITHEEIQQALNAFRREGRIITHLPDQVVPSDAAVRARWAMFDVDADGPLPAHEGLI